MMLTVEQMARELDADPEKWREYVTSIRLVQSNLGDMRHRKLDLPSKLLAIKTCQRVAFMDSDSGPIRDMADWCLHRAVALLEQNPQNVELLACEYLIHLIVALSDTFYSGREELARSCTTSTCQDSPGGASFN